MTVIRASAPVRVCDAGGWTDTWFAERGLVCSVAVDPGAAVTVQLEKGVRSVTLEVGATRETYEVPRAGIRPGHHPLLEGALQRHPVPGEYGAHIKVGAVVPPGCGVGTSAAVVVALVHALSTARGDALDPSALAREAHAIETATGLQSGVQDQHAAARGGANLIRVDPYPEAAVETIYLDDDVMRRLDALMTTVYFGRPHRSSEVHEQVITYVQGLPNADAKLGPLREAAAAAAAALRAGDLSAYGEALAANTRAQGLLHPALVNDDARRLIDLARSHRALGWKVNGAGGDGGSATVLGPADETARAALRAQIDQVGRWQRLPFHYAKQGARVRVQAAS